MYYGYSWPRCLLITGWTVKSNLGKGNAESKYVSQDRTFQAKILIED